MFVMKNTCFQAPTVINLLHNDTIHDEKIQYFFPRKLTGMSLFYANLNEMTYIILIQLLIRLRKFFLVEDLFSILINTSKMMWHTLAFMSFS